MHRIILLTTCLAASSTQADTRHKAQQMFADGPCAAVIDTIDNGPFTPEGIGNQAMMFGIILGLELERGPLNANHETALMRLRDTCAQHPEQSALQILQTAPQQ